MVVTLRRIQTEGRRFVSAKALSSEAIAFAQKII